MSVSNEQRDHVGQGAPHRERLPDTRRSVTHKFCIDGHEGYVTAGLYEDGRLGEVFIKMAKQGSTVSGLTDTVATLLSLCLQYGVPLEKLVEKFSHARFQPAGWTKNAAIPQASSVVDYLVRWLELEFSPGDPTPAHREAQSEPETLNP